MEDAGELVWAEGGALIIGTAATADLGGRCTMKDEMPASDYIFRQQ